MHFYIFSLIFIPLAAANLKPPIVLQCPAGAKQQSSVSSVGCVKDGLLEGPSVSWEGNPPVKREGMYMRGYPMIETIFDDRGIAKERLYYTRGYLGRRVILDNDGKVLKDESVPPPRIVQRNTTVKPIPIEIKKVLAAKYPAAKIHIGRPKDPPPGIPNESSVLAGDFNGDGKTDYAVQLQTPEETLIVALIQSPEGFLPYTVVKGRKMSHRAFSMIPKGSSGHDYESDSDFEYASDALFINVGGDYGQSYVFKNGVFEAISTSD